jgi:hypothetical protein
MSQTYTIVELKKICKNNGIKGYSKMNKGNKKEFIKKCVKHKKKRGKRAYTIVELKKICKNNGIKGYSKMNKGNKKEFIKKCVKRGKRAECKICLKSISKKEKRELRCGHIFHKDCIKRWGLIGNKKCPICKKKIHRLKKKIKGLKKAELQKAELQCDINMFSKDVEDIILSYKAQLEHTKSYGPVMEQLQNHIMCKLSRKMDDYVHTDESTFLADEIFPEEKYPDWDYAGEAPYLNYALYHSIVYKIRGEEYLDFMITKVSRFFPTFIPPSRNSLFPILAFNREQLIDVGI